MTIFDVFLTWPLSAGPFCNPLTLILPNLSTLYTGQIPKIWKRGLRGRKKNPVPHSPEKGRSESNNLHFPCGALDGNGDSFVLRVPFLGVAHGSFPTPKPSFPDFAISDAGRRCSRWSGSQVWISMILADVKVWGVLGEGMFPFFDFFASLFISFFLHLSSPFRFSSLSSLLHWDRSRQLQFAE